MAEIKQMILNRLPAPHLELAAGQPQRCWIGRMKTKSTWARWIRSVPGKENEPLRLEIRSEGEYSRKDVDVTAEPDSAVTIIETFGAEQNLLVRTHADRAPQRDDPSGADPEHAGRVSSRQHRGAANVRKAAASSCIRCWRARATSTATARLN